MERTDHSLPVAGTFPWTGPLRPGQHQVGPSTEKATGPGQETGSGARPPGFLPGFPTDACVRSWASYLMLMGLSLHIFKMGIMLTTLGNTLAYAEGLNVCPTASSI